MNTEVKSIETIKDHQVQKSQELEKNIITLSGLNQKQMTPKRKTPSQNSNDKLLNTESSVRITKGQKQMKVEIDKKLNIYTGCNCTKSRCLKMYCTCFSEGKMCDYSCLCDSCKNKTQNPARSEAIVEIITKDPFAFSRKSDNTDFSQTFCKCLKSGCSKKYCDCFIRGKKCGIHCKCKNCQNNQQFNDEDNNVRKKIKLF